MTPDVSKMVMYKMENVISIPKPPALPTCSLILPENDLINPKDSFSQQTTTINDTYRNKYTTMDLEKGFRLMDQQLDETGSVHSIYKQKIDSMFGSDSGSTKNSVQTKIEKMFNDVVEDNCIPVNEIGVHIFSVDYLGSIPLQEKVTSLYGLQKPLQELYFSYKRITKHKPTLTGRLEISSNGLKVHYQGEKGDLEQMNSFPTIAVWSAVKFVIREGTNPSFAFLPLVTDPENIDKKSLFKSLNENEKKYITIESHSPLFAVVMRKIGIHKQLECHGFVCQTSEDAIVIAATLYKSLVSYMKSKERKPKSRNGITCMSITSSVYNNKSHDGIPIRPPRKKRTTTSSSFETQTSISSVKPIKKSTKNKKAPKAPENKTSFNNIRCYEEPMYFLKNENMQDSIEEKSQEIKPKSFSDKINTFMSQEQKQITAEIKQIMQENSNKGLKRVQSLRKESTDAARKKENSGDIFTKVTIPRSGSFLNTGGLTRYKSKVYRTNEHTTGGSPLGFKEIFNELSLQEGLHSMDDILSVIIDPEGMSFNDLKPIYKEFLLKLAVTLTKDELYQRSKSIMRRQKNKANRNISIKTKNNHRVLVSRKFKRLKHIFQQSFRTPKIININNTLPAVEVKVEPLSVDSKLPESTISTSSSCDTRKSTSKGEIIMNRKQSHKKKSSKNMLKNRRERISTSEESDFFSLRRNKSKLQILNKINRNSSSGYVSCSECSYDSDTCTCMSADKCYCPLGQKSFHKSSGKGECSFHQSNSESCRYEDRYCTYSDTTLTFCGCDTDSCTESSKCYCMKASNRPRNTILEQLKQRGFAQSSESLLSNKKHKKLCKNNSNTRSTRSLEYMHSPCEMYYEKLKSDYKGSVRQIIDVAMDDGQRPKTCSGDNLALDYELFSIRNGNLKKLHNHISLYGNCSLENIASQSSGMHKQPSDIQSSSSSKLCKIGPLKKSSEISTLFTDMKLSNITEKKNFAFEDLPQESSASLISTQNSVNKFSSSQLLESVLYSTNLTLKQADVKSVNHYGQKLVQNALYSGRCKQNMYSTKNGLYTIQSQSDDSRRSSISDNFENNDKKYFQLEANINQLKNHKNLNDNNLENSLGYLP